MSHPAIFTERYSFEVFRRFGNIGLSHSTFQWKLFCCWLLLESAYWLLRGGHIVFWEAFSRFMLIKPTWHHFECHDVILLVNTSASNSVKDTMPFFHYLLLCVCFLSFWRRTPLKSYKDKAIHDIHIETYFYRNTDITGHCVRFILVTFTAGYKPLHVELSEPQLTVRWSWMWSGS